MRNSETGDRGERVQLLFTWQLFLRRLGACRMHTAGDGNSCIRQSCKLQPPWQCTGEPWLWGNAALFSLSGSEAGSWTGVPEGDWGIAHLVQCFTVLPQGLSCKHCIHNLIGWTSFLTLPRICPHLAPPSSLLG